jgi:hypothetical protein
MVVSMVAFLCTAVPATSSRAQVANPADKQSGGAVDQSQQVGEDHHTWVMPPVEVFGKAPLREEDRIGEYAQPRWTAHRRFGETRVYVVPKGMVEFEYWLRPEVKKNAPTEFTSMYEFEFWLPGRTQVDLYAVAHKRGKDGGFALDEQKVEVRYALADWDKIFGNPTVYAKWPR